MSEINNSNSSVEETVSSATNSTSVTPPLSPDSVVCSTNSSCSCIDNCSIQSSSTNNIQTNTTTTTSTTNACSHNTGQHNDLSGTAELGLHNAFELLDIDSEHWYVLSVSTLIMCGGFFGCTHMNKALPTVMFVSLLQKFLVLDIITNLHKM